MIACRTFRFDALNANKPKSAALLFLVLITLTSCATPTVAPPSATGSATPQRGPSSGTPYAGLGKLSVRLGMLVNSPSLRAASPDEQARALSLPPQGAGSLRHDAQGRIQVNIRVTDVGQSQVQALRDAGAMVTNVSEQYRQVTAFVAVTNLTAIASLGFVESVQEELAPGTGRGVVAPTP